VESEPAIVATATKTANVFFIPGLSCKWSVPLSTRTTGRLNQDDNLNLYLADSKVCDLIAASQITGKPLDKESTASEVDPPKSVLFVLAALITAISLAVSIRYWIMDAEPAIVFTLAITATAMVFGRTSALILSVLSFLAYDLCFSPPILTLSIPTASEVIYALINLGISLAVPWFLRRHQGEGDSVRLELA
jgi:K+-sensing histidine kinase KdpD